ncbi:ACT domain-containing protein ACR8-like protein [Tanacetum coccineum]
MLQRQQKDAESASTIGSGTPISSEAEKQRVIMCLRVVIEIKSSEGVRLELFKLDKHGLLAEVTGTFRENAMNVIEAEISTKTGTSFYKKNNIQAERMEETTPYGIGLCQRLGDAFSKCMNTNAHGSSEPLHIQTQKILKQVVHILKMVKYRCNMLDWYGSFIMTKIKLWVILALLFMRPHEDWSICKIHKSISVSETQPNHESTQTIVIRKNRITMQRDRVKDGEVGEIRYVIERESIESGVGSGMKNIAGREDESGKEIKKK